MYQVRTEKKYYVLGTYLGYYLEKGTYFYVWVHTHTDHTHTSFPIRNPCYSHKSPSDACQQHGDLPQCSKGTGEQPAQYPAQAQHNSIICDMYSVTYIPSLYIVCTSSMY